MVLDPTVRLTNCTDFNYIRDFSSPHISHYWHYMYIFYYIRLVRQYSKVIRLL